MKKLAAVLGLLTLFLGIPLLASAQFGEIDEDSKDNVVNIQIGWESHDVVLGNRETGEVLGQLSGEGSYNTNSSPVVSISTKIHFKDYSCVAAKKDTYCLLGFGARFSGGHRRLEGEWFPLESFPELDPHFYYTGNRITGQVLLGIMTLHQPILALGLETGIVSYDLLVFSGDTILVNEFSEWHTTMERSLHMNLGLVYGLTVGWFLRDLGEDKIFHILNHANLSLSETMPGKNVLYIPAYADQEEGDVEFRTQTAKIMFWWDF